MSIPERLWLPRAQRLAVGQRDRIFHLAEKRPNLVIGNDPDKFWCYCQRCKEGGVSEKTHVRLVTRAPVASTMLTLPDDMSTDPVVMEPALRHLCSKGMDLTYINPWCSYVGFSPSRQRMILCILGHWLGRDITGDSPQKWLTYNGAKYIPPVTPGSPTAVLVEDTFSYCKVQWACPNVDVYSALGAHLPDGLLLRLQAQAHSLVVIMFDGDEAGYSGARAVALRLRAFGIKTMIACAPKGHDPKDMTINDIRLHIAACVSPL